MTFRRCKWPKTCTHAEMRAAPRPGKHSLQYSGVGCAMANIVHSSGCVSHHAARRLWQRHKAVSLCRSGLTTEDKSLKTAEECTCHTVCVLRTAADRHLASGPVSAGWACLLLYRTKIEHSKIHPCCVRLLCSPDIHLGHDSVLQAELDGEIGLGRTWELETRAAVRSSADLTRRSLEQARSCGPRAGDAAPARMRHRRAACGAGSPGV